jgi:L-threonylcarbamoyladenylate synthase
MGKWQRFKPDTRVIIKKTLRLAVDANAIDSAESMASLRQAAELLRSGGTVAFPTETVYGLGANALDEAAVQAVFDAKQRPAWDPLIVHIAGEEQLRLVAGEIPPNGRLLMEAFWPGPLTLLLPKSLRVPAIVTASRPRIGVRMPGHPVARRLIEFAGVPVAAPSANSFGRTSPTRADFVLQDLDGRIDAVIDSGDSSLGLESTVVDVCEEPPILYRPGMVTFQQVQAVCRTLLAYREPLDGESGPNAQPSPGLGLKHYSPRARLILLEDAGAEKEKVRRLAERLEADGEVVGIMQPSDLTFGAFSRPYLIYRWGDLGDQEGLARRLFAGLRELDAAGATVILCPLPEDKGLGVAIRDRLLKAAR